MMFLQTGQVGRNRTGWLHARTGFLLHFDGANNSQAITDSGPRVQPFVREAGGNISTAQSVFGGSSWLSTASSGRFNINADATYITASGSTPWTWEVRYRPSSFAAARVMLDNNNLNSNTTGWQIYAGTDGKLYLYSGTQSVNYGGYGTGMSTGTWYALRIVWDGTTLYFFKDGSLLGSTTGFTNVWGSSKLFMTNSAFANQGTANDYFDEWRFIKGVALSKASYTVATRPISEHSE